LQVGGIRDTVRCDQTNAMANLLKKSVVPTDVELGKTCSTQLLHHRGRPDPAES
jgi:hypothetical protein